jgi:hypothetical protein
VISWVGPQSEGITAMVTANSNLCSVQRVILPTVVELLFDS